MSGKPVRETTKWSPVGVIVPLRRWCGVRAWLVRGSLFGLVSVRTTLFSYFAGVPYGGIAVPGPRLQGSTGNGSAAALVSDVPVAPAAAPATANPRPRRAR